MKKMNNAIMNWLSLKCMQYQLKKATKQYNTETNSIVKRAITNMVDSYKSTIMFIESNSKN